MAKNPASPAAMKRQAERIRDLKWRVATLERRVRRLVEWQVLCKSPGFRHVISRIKMLEQAQKKQRDCSVTTRNG